ncbi:MAG: efflux RND transporter periplasmic adaptor subunit [Bacteroidetes bacterium]|nr:efflux RND transporter periplasmic adaptor subunit [Bacteroidota bacterium]
MPLRRSIWLFFAFLMMLAACEKKSATNRTPGNRTRGPMMVEAFRVQLSAMSEDVEVPGSLLAAEATQIKSEVSGRIVQLNIPEGGIVPKGYLLAKLFDEDLQAQLRKLQVQLQIAIKTVERQRELLQIQGISQQDFDLSALAVDNLKADIQTTRIAISKTEIRAPYEGEIGLRAVSPGAYLSPNDIITTLRDVSKLKLEFSVPEKYAKSITKGYDITFRVDGGEMEHHAVVMATEGNIEPTTRTLKVRAIVQEKHAELVPGVFAKVNLRLGKTSSAIMLPSQAIIPEARNKRVIVMKKDSAAFRIVETGIRDSSFVQIVKGLQPGDTVITTGLMAIRPGSKLKISKLVTK